jgi:hypothetical protein
MQTPTPSLFDGYSETSTPMVEEKLPNENQKRKIPAMAVHRRSGWTWWMWGADQRESVDMTS